MRKSVNQVYLSYDQADGKAVAQIRAHLEALEVASFVDRSGPVGTLPWPRALEASIDPCRAVAFFIGSRSQLGVWQQREYTVASGREQRAREGEESFVIVPVLLPGADPRVGLLFSQPWIDLRGGIGDDEGVDLLARALVISANGKTHARIELPELCPYRGLESFRREDEPFFFGREAFTRRLLDKILEYKMVAVVGPSGSGKSSVVQAGLIPALAKHPTGRSWEVATLRPGDRPFHCLAHAIAPLLWRDLDDLDQEEKAERLGDQLKDRHNRLEIQVEKLLAGSGGSTRLLLVVDQFEELFRETFAGQREPFVDAVLGAMDSSRLSVVFTLRADFVDHVLRLGTELADRFYDRVVYLSDQLSQDMMARIVRGPADLVGLEFEEGLEQLVLKDVGSGPGRLPLLEFCLRGLWEERDEGKLTHAGYAKIGGVEGALAQHAERALAELGPRLARTARSLFIDRLVRVASDGEAGKDTKRQAEIAELSEEEREVVARFSAPDVRLLVAGESSVEVVHDALLERWTTLREWLQVDRERLRQEQQFRGVRAVEELAATMVLDEGFLEEPRTFLGAVTERLVVLANEHSPFANLSESLWRLDYLAANGESDAIRARAKALGQELRVALERVVLDRTGNSPPDEVPGTFIAIEPGLNRLRCVGGEEAEASFCMGSEERGNEGPVHPVVLSPFKLQARTVTQAEYVLFDPDHGGTEPELPVIEVSWHEAYAYAAWLGGRLPTEAEWEFACRAGSTTRWSFGDDESQIGVYGWIAGSSGNAVHPPGQLEPNPWGLYDMHGNVWEWVSDRWGEYGSELEIDPYGTPLASDRRVFRGGSFVVGSVGARSAYRVGVAPSSHGNDLGFRVWLPAG